LRFWATVGGLDAYADDLTVALAGVGLERVADARVRTFSAGMKRRLSLARVMLARPRVLLLDEPFAGLDQRARKWLEGRLEAMKAAGAALLMVTHSFGRELGIADRLAVLAGGRIWNGLSKLKKDNTGYDLKNLFVGAEGTLGIITAATLKLFPRPRAVETAFVGLASPDAALALLGLAAERLERKADGRDTRDLTFVLCAGERARRGRAARTRRAAP